MEHPILVMFEGTLKDGTKEKTTIEVPTIEDANKYVQHSDQGMLKYYYDTWKFRLFREIHP